MQDNLHQRNAVAVISGPTQAYELDGRFTTVMTDITRVRFERGVGLSVRSQSMLVVSVKTAELPQFTDMTRCVLQNLGLQALKVHIEAGAAHTLANAWFLLRWAKAHCIARLTVVTSAWHVRRVRYVFAEMNTVVQGIGNPLKVTVHSAPFSRDGAVRKFERMVALPREQRLLQLERHTIRKYREALAALNLPSGQYPPHPDEVSQFVLPEEYGFVLLNSQLEPEDGPRSRLELESVHP